MGDIGDDELYASIEREAYLRGLREAEQLLRKRAADWRVLHGSEKVRWLATDADAAADAIERLIAKAEAERGDSDGG